MNKKLIAGIFILFSLLSPSAYSKDKPVPPPKPMTTDDIVAKMTVQLGLTDQQASQVKPIIENYLALEKQIKLEEKRQLRHVLTDQQMYTWNFLQNEQPKEKKKKSF